MQQVFIINLDIFIVGKRGAQKAYVSGSLFLCLSTYLTLKPGWQLVCKLLVHPYMLSLAPVSVIKVICTQKCVNSLGLLPKMLLLSL